MILVQIERDRDEGRPTRALEMAQAFHNKLCRVRVLDPACGTGNFLYIAMDLMKRLEAEVLEIMSQLRHQQQLELETIGPRQFFGLEVNPRAAVIAELVLWIGYLQLHYRTHSGHPVEPILKAFGTIASRDAILAWDGYPKTRRTVRPGDGEVAYPDPHPAPWPDVDFIVGNPPFMGGKDLRTRLGDRYAEALWAAYPHMNRSADLVMYWWDRAADRLTRPGSSLRRFGFVTTNSIVQSHQRRVVERRLAADPPIHLSFATPDHPWTRVGGEAAAVRVAMTVGAPGRGAGVLLTLTEEPGIGASARLTRAEGVINADLSIGLDLTRAAPLRANAGLCSPGVKLHGAGFIVSFEQAQALGLGRRPGLEAYVRPYRNGRDVVQHSRGAWVIDLYPLEAGAVRRRFPEVYQHLLTTVKPHREANRMAFRRENWWWFGATHEVYRSFTATLPRYIVTPETAKHRIFVFLPAGVRADNMLVAVGVSDAYHLGVLSSRPHQLWARAMGAVLEDRPRYTKSACFDTFPFPEVEATRRAAIDAATEELHALRLVILEEHPDLTLTALYNALDDLRAKRELDAARLRDGRILILDELHRAIDAQVEGAYGWPNGLGSASVLERLLALNAKRRGEELVGSVAWLRPDFQAPRFSRMGEKPVSSDLAAKADDARYARPPSLPRDRAEQSVAVLQRLEASDGALSAAELAGQFAGAGRNRARVDAALDVLWRYGRVSRLPDGRFAARRIA